MWAGAAPGGGIPSLKVAEGLSGFAYIWNLAYIILETPRQGGNVR